MIVCYKHNFAFIHIPKNAGTSVFYHFRKFTQPGDIVIPGRKPSPPAPASPGGKICLGKHSTARGIARALGDEKFRSLRKFAVVRNPFARAGSAFSFLKRWKRWRGSEIMDRFDTLEEFVTSESFEGNGFLGILNPQFSWLTDASGEICTDYIARFETLDADIAAIQRSLKLGAMQGKLVWRNADP
jgi:Sulfotransferase family